MNDSVDCLPGSERIHRNGDVGRAVEREATIVPTSKVGVVSEDGADVLRAGATGEGCE